MAERTVVVHWEGPFDWDRCSKQRAKGHVLYALYGSHHLYGRDVLLYLGRSEEIGKRIGCHGKWVEDEYDAMRVRFASIGDFIGWAEWNEIDRYPPADKSLVAAVEALLIQAHQPAYNTMNKSTLQDAGLRILNTGRIGHLLPEVSSLYHTTEEASKNEDIIDTQRNPFARPSWIKQGLSFTNDRKAELALLWGETVQAIMSGDDNTSQYPAFIGIRWGFAVICVCGRLVPTEKWNNPAFSSKGRAL